ncbi:MAG: sialate O-acetylesterase [Phycisphaerales bacterium]|nr:sialate O-acetylesterase [Phycisphaerales bacterium]
MPSTLAAIGIALVAGATPSTLPGLNPTFKIFLLAGQSNMEGQAVVAMDHPEHYNGGRGNLVNTMKDPEFAKRMSHLRDENGDWTVRDDAFCWYKTDGGELKAGPLSIGFAGYPGRDHFGPELQIGHLLADACTEPVLLIKTAWGGKNLHVDFRPPSAGGTVGPYYTRMLEEYAEGVRDAQRRFPALRGSTPELAGFIWFQGWNDMYVDGGIDAYAANLVHLAADLRRHFDDPDLPIVVGETGNAGNDRFREQQRLGTDRIPPPSAFVATRSFLRKPGDSPNQGHGHHWYGNAASYFLVGDGLGTATIQLLKTGP